MIQHLPQVAAVDPAAHATPDEMKYSASLAGSPPMRLPIYLAARNCGHTSVSTAHFTISPKPNPPPNKKRMAKYGSHCVPTKK